MESWAHEGGPAPHWDFLQERPMGPDESRLKALMKGGYNCRDPMTPMQPRSGGSQHRRGGAPSAARAP